MPVAVVRCDHAGFAVAVRRTRLTAQFVIRRIEAVGRRTALLTERVVSRRHFADYALLHLYLDLDLLDMVVIEIQVNGVDSSFGEPDGLESDTFLGQQKTLRSGEKLIRRGHGGGDVAEVSPDGWTLMEVISYLYLDRGQRRATLVVSDAVGTRSVRDDGRAFVLYDAYHGMGRIRGNDIAILSSRVARPQRTEPL